MSTESAPVHRRPDLVGLVIAAVFLMLGIGAITGHPLWMFSGVGMWIIIGVVSLLGVGLLLSAIPRRK